MPPLTIHILYNKNSTFGLTDDVAVIERVLKQLQDKIGQPIGKPKLLDMREPPIQCDIQFHLEIPVFSSVPWAHTNVLLVNPEQWYYTYDSYTHAFDALLFRDPDTLSHFKEDFSKKGLRIDNLYLVPWCPSLLVKDMKDEYGNGSEGFVCFIAGSSSKYEYVKKLLIHWAPHDPSLTIYTTRQDFKDDLDRFNSSNITIKHADLDENTRKRLMTFYRGHLVCSQGESFGYAAANTEICGAYTIMNRLPCFEYMYDEVNTGNTVSWISNEYTLSDKVRYKYASPTSNIRRELEKAFDGFRSADFEGVRKERQEISTKRFKTTCNEFERVLHILHGLVKERKPKTGHFHYPPVLSPNECPAISIITPTYNREKLIEIAFHNLLVTDYPHDKIEWIVVEDNETKNKMNSEAIISFQIQVPKIKLKYVPIEGRMTIGEKRNIGVENASNDIILFMDDDDHYPITSFRRRVAWLTKGTKAGKTGESQIACCTTLALYDLKFGTSAVNVPPFDIPFAQRISEATLTFRKSAWETRKFPNVSISEGEEWITGREDLVIEMPPQQIIVAFSHNSNKSSRRIPPSENKPACFWGFPKEYLIFIHRLAGVEVEEEKTTLAKKTKKF